MNSITIGNGLIERIFRYDMSTKRFFTSRLTNKKTGTNWAVCESAEFSVKIADDGGSGGVRNVQNLTSGALVYETHATKRLPDGRTQLVVLLNDVQASVRVHLLYELHPDHAWIRKRIKVENVGDKPFLLQQYDTECLNLPGNLTAHYFASWRWGGQFAEKGMSARLSAKPQVGAFACAEMGLLVGTIKRTIKRCGCGSDFLA